jgi:hypothetical protein
MTELVRPGYLALVLDPETEPQAVLTPAVWSTGHWEPVRYLFSLETGVYHLGVPRGSDEMIVGCWRRFREVDDETAVRMLLTKPVKPSQCSCLHDGLRAPKLEYPRRLQKLIRRAGG